MVKLEDSIISRLEDLGANQVRTLMTSGNLPTGWNVGGVTEWLAEKDQEDRRSTVCIQGEQIEIAKTAADAAVRAADAAERASFAAERQARAAERANTRATIALIIAIISAMATIASIAIPLLLK